MFSLEDLRNITAGVPTASAIAAGRQAAAVAANGLAQPAGAAMPARPSALLEQQNPHAVMDNLEAELARRVQKKAAQGPPPAPRPTIIQESAAPPAPMQFTVPPGGYPGPGLPVQSQAARAGTYDPSTGGVPPAALSRFFPGMAPVAPTPLYEQFQPGLPTEVPGTTPPSGPLNTEEVRKVVREVLFNEVLESDTLLPLLQNMVKATLHLVVREELERLQRMGLKK